MSSLGSRLTKLDSDYNIRQVAFLPHFASIIIRFSVCAHGGRLGQVEREGHPRHRGATLAWRRPRRHGGQPGGVPWWDFEGDEILRMMGF